MTPARAHFSWDAVSAEWLEMFEEISPRVAAE